MKAKTNDENIKVSAVLYNLEKNIGKATGSNHFKVKLTNGKDEIAEVVNNIRKEKKSFLYILTVIMIIIIIISEFIDICLDSESFIQFLMEIFK